MSRFLVIEARRLLPLLFLLVLLVSLSVYDNFFRLESPVTAPEPGVENVLSFITADRGSLEVGSSIQVIQTSEQWQALRAELAELPDYPFNAAYEVAVKAVNAEIKSIGLFPQADGMQQVQVRVSPQQGAYHVVTVEREKLEEQSRWLFLDEQDNLLAEEAVPDILVQSPAGDE